MRMGRSFPGATLALMAVLFMVGCATSQADKVTWDSAVAIDDTTTAAKTKTVAKANMVDFRTPPQPALGNKPLRKSTGPVMEASYMAPLSDEPARILIDRAIARFNARRAGLKRAPKTSPAHERNWMVLLDVVDTACGIAPVTEDLGAFIRARVTLEAEIEQDRRGRILVSPLVAERIDQTIRFVDMRVQELRPIMPKGHILPAGSLRDGPLFIRQPVATLNVTSPYGVRTDPFTGRARFHAGIDVGVAHGTPVNSAADGVVIFAGWQGGFGRHIVLDHGDGIRTHYSHLSHIYVKAGEIVDAGHVVGLVGSTGRSTGPHLHFAVTNAKGHFLDPIELINVPLYSEAFDNHESARDKKTGKSAPTRLAARP
jgi:hypothetical protein